MRSDRNIIVQQDSSFAYDADSLVISKAGLYKKAALHHVCRVSKETDSAFYFRYNTHTPTIDEAILIYCMDGEGFIHGTSIQTVHPGNFVFCDKDCVHAYGSNPQNPWTIYWFHFLGAFSDFFAEMMHSKHDCTLINTESTEPFLSKVHAILELLSDYPDFIRITTANSLLKACLGEILMCVNKVSIPTSFPDSINSALEYMKHHLHENLTLDLLSDYVCLSKFYFSREFKKAMGYAPLAYFNLLKMKRAYQLLEDHRYSIQEISHLLGYSTPYYFSNSFKKMTGFSPKKYRELIKSQF